MKKKRRRKGDETKEKQLKLQNSKEKENVKKKN
jgi:hypothetical protein